MDPDDWDEHRHYNGNNGFNRSWLDVFMPIATLAVFGIVALIGILAFSG